MDTWAGRLGMVLVSVVIGVASAVGTVYLAGDRILDVDARLADRVEREVDAAVEQVVVDQKSNDQRQAEAIATVLSDHEDRLKGVEGRSYALSDGFCSGAKFQLGQRVVTDVQLIPGFGTVPPSLTARTVELCVDEQ